MTLTEQEVAEITTYLLDQPAKFSNPILSFFDSKIKAMQAKENTKTEELPEKVKK